MGDSKKNTIEDIETKEEALEYLRRIKKRPAVPLKALECRRGPGSEKVLKDSKIPLKTYLDYMDSGKIEEFLEDYDVPSETEKILREGF